MQDNIGKCGKLSLELFDGRKCSTNWDCWPTHSFAVRPSPFFCSLHDHHCHLKGDSGDECNGPGECKSWLFCGEGLSGRCFDRSNGTLGSVCGGPLYCHRDLQCIDEHCQRLRKMNEPCDPQGIVCELDGLCSDGKCEPWQHVNEGGGCSSILPLRKGLEQLNEACKPGLVCGIGNNETTSEFVDGKCIQQVKFDHEISCENSDTECPDGSL